MHCNRLKKELEKIELELGPRHEYVHHAYEWERLGGVVYRGGEEKDRTEEWERLRGLGGSIICWLLRTH